MQTAIFPGEFDSLAKICAFVADAAREAGLDDKAVYQVELAVDEACTNIIEHAYGGEGKGEIHCSYEITGKGLTVTLRDRGRSFDPSDVPEPNLKAKLQELESRGAGLYLMKKMMDRVKFDFSPHHGNTLTMVKYRK